MWLLIVGFLLFLGAHLSPGVLGLRATLVGRLGEGRFRAVYIVMSVTGMLCIIAGKYIAPFVHVWTPPAWGRMAALDLVVKMKKSPVIRTGLVKVVRSRIEITICM